DPRRRGRGADLRPGAGDPEGARAAGRARRRLVEAAAGARRVARMTRQIDQMEDRDTVLYPTPPMLLRLRDVLARSGYSESGLYEAMARGEFPRPRKRGATAVW